MTAFASPVTHVADLIPRDRWGRPLIAPADGGAPVPYTRISTLAKTLDDKTALMKWQSRQTALGLAARPDLMALVKSAKPDDKRKLDGICKDAQEAAGSHAAANIGTALHSFTEAVDDGAEPDSFGPEYAEALTNYRTTMAEIEVIAKELFVVVDEVQAAGTFDRLLRLPDGRLVIGDIKTGQDNDYPHGAATQIATYAHGHLYHPEQGRIGHLPSMGVDVTVGLLIHLSAKDNTCSLYELDLTVGWGLAQTAAVVKRIYKDKPIRPYSPASS